MPKPANRFEKFFEFSPDLMCVASRDGFFKELNPAWEETLGYSIDALLAHPLIEFVHPDDVQPTLKEHQKIVQGRATANFVNRYRCKDGSYKWLEWRATPAVEAAVFYAIARDITLRKKAEDALYASEEKFSSILRSSPMGILLYQLKTDGRLIMTGSNVAVDRMLGIAHDALYGLTIEEAYPELAASRIPELYCKVARGELALQSFETFYKDDRFSGYYDVAVFQIAPGAIAVSFTDITVRKQVENLLKESERRYRSLFNGMQEGFALHEIICDASGKPVDYRFLVMNPAFEWLTGLKIQDVINKTVREVLPQTESSWIERYGRVALTGISETFEQYSQNIGKYYRVTAFCPEKGQFAVFFDDITDRRRTMDALMASEEKYRRLHDSMVDAFSIVSLDGRFLECNHSLCEMMGYDEREILTLSYADLTPRKWHSLDADVVEKQVLACGHSDAYEKEFIRKDGTIFPAELRVYLIRDQEGSPAGMWAIIKDITARREIAGILNEQRNALQESEANLKRFSQMILSIREEEKRKLSVNLHDEVGAMAVALNSGLSVIQSNIERNNYKSVLKDIRKTKAILKKEIAVFRNIVEDLRPPNLDVVGLPGVLKDYFLKMVEDRGLDIQFKDESGVRPLSDQVAIALYRVTQEAMTNIIKHAKARKVIVSLTLVDGRIKYTIRDNGRGFNMKSISISSKVFKLGIQGMQERIEALGGTFSLDSSPRKGTTISILVSPSGSCKE